LTEYATTPTTAAGGIRKREFEEVVMHYFCLACRESLKRSEVERFPDGEQDVEYRRHIGCPSAQPALSIEGTAILFGVSEQRWTDGEEQIPLEEWLRLH
jgi:hypothetical protein